jgi:hypothetical protein
MPQMSNQNLTLSGIGQRRALSSLPGRRSAGSIKSARRTRFFLLCFQRQGSGSMLWSLFSAKLATFSSEIWHFFLENQFRDPFLYVIRDKIAKSPTMLVPGLDVAARTKTPSMELLSTPSSWVRSCNVKQWSGQIFSTRGPDRLCKSLGSVADALPSCLTYVYTADFERTLMRSQLLLDHSSGRIVF